MREPFSFEYSVFPKMMITPNVMTRCQPLKGTCHPLNLDLNIDIAPTKNREQMNVGIEAIDLYQRNLGDLLNILEVPVKRVDPTVFCLLKILYLH